MRPVGRKFSVQRQVQGRPDPSNMATPQPPPHFVTTHQIQTQMSATTQLTCNWVTCSKANRCSMWRSFIAASHSADLSISSEYEARRLSSFAEWWLSISFRKASCSFALANSCACMLHKSNATYRVECMVFVHVIWTTAIISCRQLYINEWSCKWPRLCIEMEDAIHTTLSSNLVNLCNLVCAGMVYHMLVYTTMHVQLSGMERLIMHLPRYGA